MVNSNFEAYLQRTKAIEVESQGNDEISGGLDYNRLKGTRDGNALLKLYRAPYIHNQLFRSNNMYVAKSI